jgi:hypothetical protein
MNKKLFTKVNLFAIGRVFALWPNKKMIKLLGKSMLQWTFLEVPMVVFMGESNIAAL